MSSPCNNLNVVPIKVSQLARYQNLDVNDLFLTVESGSSLISRRSTLGDVKNTLNKLTGSYTGSFSGSFIGIFTGKGSGSFSGSHYGKFVGKNASLSGSFSGSFYGSSKFTQTASYLKKTNSNLEYSIPYYDSEHLTSTANNNSYGGLFWSSNFGGYTLLKMSSSVPTNYIIVDSKATNNFGQSHLILSNNCNRVARVPSYNWGPEGWDIFSNTSGSLIWNSLTGSYQFTNNVYTAGGKYPYFSALKQIRNNFYFWADPFSYSSICRDGAIGIGVAAANTPTASFGSYLKAKLQIDMFSASINDIGRGSWGNATGVEHRHTAILVRYGSGSAVTGMNTTFYVSSSGNTLIGGKLNVNRGITGSLYGTGFRLLNGKSVSLWATGSHAVSASYVSGPARLYNSFNNASDSTNFATYTWSLSVTKPSNGVWSEFDCFIDHLGRTDNGLTLTGNILFDSDGTNVSSQYSNNTGCGNSGMTWGGTVDNDSCLVHWHHQGNVRTADASSNTFTLRFIINKTAGSYDLATPTTYYGIKAKYYIP